MSAEQEASGVLTTHDEWLEIASRGETGPGVHPEGPPGHGADIGAAEEVEYGHADADSSKSGQPGRGPVEDGTGK